MKPFCTTLTSLQQRQQVQQTSSPFADHTICSFLHQQFLNWVFSIEVLYGTPQPVLHGKYTVCTYTLFLWSDILQRQTSVLLKYHGVKSTRHSWSDRCRKDDLHLWLFLIFQFKLCAIQERHLMLGVVEKIPIPSNCASSILPFSEN